MSVAVYVVILMRPGLGDGFSIVGIHTDYERAHAEARQYGLDRTLVQTHHLSGQ